MIPFLRPAFSSDTSYKIARSARFRSNNSAYFSRTFGAPTSLTTTSLSMWLKLGTLGVGRTLIAGSSSNSASLYLQFTSGNTLQITNGAGTVVKATSAVYRDPSAHMHVVWVHDTTNSTAGDRWRLYVNGARLSVTGTDPGLNATFNWNASGQVFSIGAYIGPAAFFDGLLSEIQFVDGQALSPSDFGQTDPVTGVWVPKAYSGSYGANGFYLDFSDNSAATSSTIGKDRSGNNNDWTPTGISVTAGVTNDSLTDTPTNYGSDTGLGGEVRGNYPTMTPIYPNAVGLVDGNLGVLQTTNNRGAISTQAIPVGVVAYAEFTPTATPGGGIELYVGVNTTPDLTSASRGGLSTGYSYYHATGEKNILGSLSSYGSAWSTLNKIGIRVDRVNHLLTFYVDGVSQGNISIPSSTDLFFWQGSGGGTSQVGGYWNFGQRPFSFAAPAGANCLCTQNLPDPAILLPGQYMKPLLYTGTGNVARSLTGLGFQPDWVWIKARSTAYGNVLYDSVRGTGSIPLVSNTTDSETVNAAFSNLASFDSDGFSLGTTSSTNVANDFGQSFVAWCWKKGLLPGFDIVTYTGTGAARTVAHGLGVVPAMIIPKNRNGSPTYNGWNAYHKNANASPQNGYVGGLQSTGGFTSDSTAFNNTAPTSSVFSVGSNMSVIGVDYVAYVFAEVPDFSKFGSYTGNGGADGPFIWTGFRPRWVMVKRVDTTSNWQILDTTRDTYNVAQNSLFPNLSNAETSGYAVDILANGFKQRDTSYNATGGTYIFAAFAEAPFKYARSR